MEELIFNGLKRESLRIEEDCTHTAKGHYAASRRWGKIYYWIGIPNTILAGVGGISIVSKLEIVGAIIAGIVSVITGISTFLNPMGKSNKHLSAGNSFNEKKNKSRFFREIELSIVAKAEEAKAILEKLAMCKDELNKSSPQVPGWAFEKAKKGILKGEATYKVDE